MDAIMDDPFDSVFEFAVDFHTPSRGKLGNLELEPIVLDCVTGNLELLRVVMLGSVASGAL